MAIFVAVLIIALIAAIGFAVMQRRSAGAAGTARPRTSPLRRPRGRGFARRDPMAAAVAEHARAIEPRDVVVAEQRLRAQARQVAAGLRGGAAIHPDPLPTGAVYADPSLADHVDPVTGVRTDGYGDPATDPRYGDPRYDGRLAADYVDPRYGDGRR